MFQGGGGLPPQLQAMLAGGMGGGGMGGGMPPGPMGGTGAAPRVPMPGFSPGAGGAIPMAGGGGAYGGLGGQGKPGGAGMFGAMDPASILQMANMFKPQPGAPAGGPQSLMGGGAGNPMAGGQGGWEKLLGMLPGGGMW